MCVNQRLVRNIYTHKELYVPCGKCLACLQEKAAHRVLRIQNTKSDAVEVMMVGLRLNLKRNFNYNETFKAYCCSEYGSKSHRPHFHILFFIR